jgi:hypothetical protein
MTARSLAQSSFASISCRAISPANPLFHMIAVLRSSRRHPPYPTVTILPRSEPGDHRSESVFDPARSIARYA